jgi:hypothetical protein
MPDLYGPYHIAMADAGGVGQSLGRLPSGLAYNVELCGM